jgi:hypothetical protein
MWRRYYSAGALAIDHIGERDGKIRVVEFDPLSKAWCYDFGGWLQRTMELNGLDHVEIRHSECTLDGAPACAFEGSFRQRIRSA